MLNGIPRRNPSLSKPAMRTLPSVSSLRSTVSFGSANLLPHMLPINNNKTFLALRRFLAPIDPTGISLCHTALQAVDHPKSIEWFSSWHNHVAICRLWYRIAESLPHKSRGLCSPPPPHYTSLSLPLRMYVRTAPTYTYAYFLKLNKVYVMLKFSGAAL